MKNKKEISEIINIYRRDITENLLYEHDFTSTQQKIIIAYWNKLFKDLKKDIMLEIIK